MSRDRRDHIVSARFTEAERARLGRLADAEGLTPSEYLRRAALPSPPAQVLDLATSGIAPGHTAVWADPVAITGNRTAVVWADGTTGPTWHSPDWPGCIYPGGEAA